MQIVVEKKSGWASGLFGGRGLEAVESVKEAVEDKSPIVVEEEITEEAVDVEIVNRAAHEKAIEDGPPAPAEKAIEEDAPVEEEAPVEEAEEAIVEEAIDEEAPAPVEKAEEAIVEEDIEEEAPAPVEEVEEEIIEEAHAPAEEAEVEAPAPAKVIEEAPVDEEPLEKVDRLAPIAIVEEEISIREEASTPAEEAIVDEVAPVEEVAVEEEASAPVEEKKGGWISGIFGGGGAQAEVHASVDFSSTLYKGHGFNIKIEKDGEWFPDKPGEFYLEHLGKPFYKDLTVCTSR
jgi:hypothetical protein